MHEALDAFIAKHNTISDGEVKITLQRAQPCYLPFYVFEGDLGVRFTGTIGYEDDEEFTASGIQCAPFHLGADQGSIGAVYAGFDFRRLLVRRALAADLSDHLLQTAIPEDMLSADDKPRGTAVHEFTMKPSFAYKFRVLERLPEVAHHLAERHMQGGGVDGVVFEAAAGAAGARGGGGGGGGDGGGDGGGGGATLAARTPAAHPPAYTLVDDVTFEVSGARLHDKGVVQLPAWVVTYACLGKQYRGFVSAVQPSQGEQGGGGVGGVRVAGMRHFNPLAEPSATGDASLTWRAIGDWRRHDAEANLDWKVQRYWLEQVARVMPDSQKPTGPTRAGAGSRGFASFLPGGGDVSDEDYELLGLTPPRRGRSALGARGGVGDGGGGGHASSGGGGGGGGGPTSREIRQAFHAQAMIWHPDLQGGKGEEERAACHERFQRIVKAHERLRARHPEYLDHTVHTAPGSGDRGT